LEANKTIAFNMNCSSCYIQSYFMAIYIY